MSTAPPLPPKPVADRDTQPFWDAVAEHRLVVQRCRECARFVWQPRPLCPHCHAEDPEWVELEGAATVVSWTVLHPPVLAVWQDAIPFTVLLVEPDDAPGVRMVGQLVEPDGTLVRGDEGVDFGVRVELRWRVDEAGQALPAWTLVTRRP